MTSLKTAVVAFVVCAGLACPFGATAKECPRALKWMKQKDLVKAEREARNCLKRRPGRPAYHFLLARILAAQERYDEALAWLAKARKRVPRNHEIQAWQARVLAWKGELDLAWEGVADLPAKAYRNRDTARFVADLAYWRNDFETALQKYDYYLRRWPKDPTAVRNRALCRWQLGQGAKAQEEFRDMCAKWPELERSCELWQSVTLLNNLDLTEEEWASLGNVGKRPDLVTLEFLRARIAAAQKKYELALAWLDEAEAREPDNAQVAAWRVRILAWSGKLAEAWEESKKLPEEESWDYDLARLMADLAYWTEHYELAVGRYDAVLAKDPDDVAAFTNRAMARWHLGLYEQAEADFEILGIEPPWRSEPCDLTVARDYLNAGDPEDAESAAMQCLAQRPDQVSTWYLLSRIFTELERYDEALEWVDAALKRYPDDLQLQAWRVRIIARRGDLDRAWLELRAFPASAFDDQETARLAGDLAFWRNDWEVAIRRYDSYLERWPDDTAAAKNRALAYDGLGETSRAQDDLQLLCDLEFEENGACLALGRLKRRASRYALLAQPGYMLNGTRTYGFNEYLHLSARASDDLALGAAADVRHRSQDPGINTDVYFEGSANKHIDKHWSLYGSAGFTVAADFSPVWAVQVQPCYRFDNGVQLRLKYWRMQFKELGSNIFSPRASMYLGPFFYDVRYFLTIDDNGDVGNSGLGKVMYFFHQFSVHVGAGVGDRTDYIYQELPDGKVDRFWLVLGGIGWQFHWRHRISFDYSYRNERASSAVTPAESEDDLPLVTPVLGSQVSHKDLHEFLLGYKVNF